MKMPDEQIFSELINMIKTTDNLSERFKIKLLDFL
jgi:hypothetical protein